MQEIQCFEDLKVWRDAMELCHEVYRESNPGEFGRDFALKNQIRRAAISVVSNIAEGFESRTDKLFREFLGRAKASAGELRAQLYIARREEYMGEPNARRLISAASSVSRQIAGLMKYLDACSPTRRRPL